MRAQFPKHSKTMENLAVEMNRAEDSEGTLDLLKNYR